MNRDFEILFKKILDIRNSAFENSYELIKFAKNNLDHVNKHKGNFIYAEYLRIIYLNYLIEKEY